MSPDQFDKVQSLFLALRHLPRADAVARARDAARDDPAVADALIAMLEHDAPDDEPSGRLPPLPGLEEGAGLAGFLRAAQPGQRLGEYDIIRLIGVGGQAEVYEAEQRSPRRRVAVKIIKPGMDSRDVLQRFDAERQALAIMDHPNIAKVFDSGVTPQGRPYFVMQYVPGVPITEHCDRTRMPIRTRLELFSTLCDAVAHAHTKGVIHRDLKPSNVLVYLDDKNQPVPVVIDFGVAKATQARLSAETIFTSAGALIGTPAYMSPEQADLAQQDIDTRSDVYSLGVMLYELLTGNAPFDAASLRERGLEEIRRVIREEEPEKPSTRVATGGAAAALAAEARQTRPRDLARQLTHELDWIPLKAIRKERAERYRSAQELGDDLRNYLVGRPLIAGPESAWYRTKKFVRRHRLQVVGAAAVGAAIIVGSGVALWQRDAAIRARNAERQQRQLAEATQEFWSKIVGQAASLYGGQRATIRQAVDLAAQSAETPGSQGRLGEASRANLLAEAYFNLMDYPQAASWGARAHEQYALELGEDNLPTARARWNAAISSWPLKGADSLDELDAACRATLVVTSASDPAQWERMAVTAALSALGGRTDQAQRWLGELERARAVAGDPPDSKYAGQVEMVRAQLSRTPTERLSHWRKAGSILEASLGPEHRETIESLQYGAFELSYGVRDLEQAVAAYQDLLARARKVYAPPNLLLADNTKELAACLMILDREEDAERNAQEAIAMYAALGVECDRVRTRDLLLGLEQMHRRLGHAQRADDIVAQRRELEQRCAAAKDTK